MLQNATLLRKSAPGPSNSSDEDVSCTAPATEMHLCRSSSNVPRLPSFVEITFCSLLIRCTIPCACHAKRHLNVQKWSAPLVFLTCWLRNVLPATTACTFSTSQLPKVVRTWCALYILTSKCALRHNGVHFFDISTSKSSPDLVCFVHFDIEMCFPPQRPALFRHLNFQKWSGPGVFCTFWFRHVLPATTACTFSSLIWPAGSAPAALASLLFDPPEPQIIGKTQCSRLPCLFAHLHLLSSDSFSSLIFSLLLFSSLWLFPSLLFICPYCRKFDFQTSFDHSNNDSKYDQPCEQGDHGLSWSKFGATASVWTCVLAALLRHILRDTLPEQCQATSICAHNLYKNRSISVLIHFRRISTCSKKNFHTQACRSKRIWDLRQETNRTSFCHNSH